MSWNQILVRRIAIFLALLQSVCLSASLPENWQATQSKVSTAQKAGGGTRALMIYHIGPLHEEANSMDIMTNNVKLFTGSIGKDQAASKDFYIFNVVGESHPLEYLVPKDLPNVGLVQWKSADSDLATHLRTLEMLTVDVTNKFEAVLFVNHGVRGPIVRRTNGEWIEDFTRPLRSNNVAMVGPTLSCEVSPHVQTHMFALRTSLIPFVQAQMKEKLEAKYKSWVDLVASLEVGLTGLIMNAGNNVSSFMHQSRGQATHFTHCLKYDGPQNLVDQNPTSWCGLSPETLVFVKWGGEAMRNPGYMCNSMVNQMDDALEQTARAEPHLQLTVPEVRRGGRMSKVFKMYAQEAWIDRQPVLLYTNATIAAGQAKIQELRSTPKVCFLVRVLVPHLLHFKYENPGTNLINKELKLFIASLQRQKNPNWVAMFYRIDNAPEHSKLNSLLNAYNDPRLEFLSKGGLHYSAADAGYGATDKFLLRALQRSECQWISVTTSDNAYGSEVVQRVMAHRSDAPMLQVPLDSKRYFDQLKPILLQAPNRTIDLAAPVLTVSGVKLSGDIATQPTVVRLLDPAIGALGCTLSPRLEATGFTHLIHATPESLRLDLAAVFMNAEKLRKEKVLFGHFSDRSKYPCYDTAVNSTDPAGYLCLNAQGAHLLHHLAQRSNWALAQLPADGLKSAVFHGNSPTLCIGADHIWFDHKDPLQQRCFTSMDAFRMLEKPEYKAAYDFPNLWDGQGPVIGSCLRMRDPKTVKQ
uniref:Uncharacterized protein n=1 Tax=Spumella elongata TaxID=89044 RepID=A0A7S3H5N8_9STRA|mmetsp:Transcript_35924/g.61863  ORF Transcript_35924/g.61863 Transcript_35924/m.61863 type:complete len:751 (+) Transcript_35924:32-2284(+)|eukprot:CAMPEP_0184989766 /NCGR_PEP_ID=MMETSP1098-20130426/29986_1 /TAXON_ID=89044 /ORGANISM="Spumella elongata, Strain CCAP 955/1" /LENGTH=750 /DNA_ID=CAMNT_0027514831 /DNA_START=32 /DNA_END=2284 /DNA_ORIENTATION=-